MLETKLKLNLLFVAFRYTERQIPGVLYASVNPEYMNSSDGRLLWYHLEELPFDTFVLFLYLKPVLYKLSYHCGYVCFTVGSNDFMSRPSCLFCFLFNPANVFLKAVDSYLSWQH